MNYVARPVVVDAFKIVEVKAHETAQSRVTGESDCVDLTLEDGRSVLADAGMLARYHPAIGDYWVVQKDGYVYLNPKDVFERKYILSRFQ